MKIIKSYKKIEDGKFKVKSFTNNKDEYIVDINNMTCNCYVFINKSTFCKHIDFVLEQEKISQR